jgi:uncharacterized protein YkwD
MIAAMIHRLRRSARIALFAAVALAGCAAPERTDSPAAAGPAADGLRARVGDTRSAALPSPGAEPGAVAVDPRADTLLALVNDYRRRHGRPALAADAILQRVAHRHGADMAARGYFDHVTPEGGALEHRLWNARYRFAVAAENLALGYRAPDAVMAGWRSSPGHDRNLLRGDVSAAGIGVIDARTPDGPVWVLLLAQPRP